MAQIMTAVEKLLAQHLTDVREQIALAISRADTLEALIGKLAHQATTGATAVALPAERRLSNGWSIDEDELLRDEYPTIGAAGCVKLLPHRTAMAIRVRASRELGVKQLCGPGVQRPRLWCSQCERNVLATEALGCTSVFCKAGKEQRGNALRAHDAEEDRLAERLNAEARLPSSLS